MSEVALLCEITTVPGSAKVESFNFIIGNVPGLDGLEYHLGMSRGEITEYTDMMTASLHPDMVELFQSSSWALLPGPGVIEKMWELYSYNQSRSTATLARKKFTEEIPVSEDKLYQYELMPVCTPDKLPVYVGEKRYDYPYSGFPLVETSIHPCFVLKSLCKYLVRGNLDYAPSSLTDDARLRSIIGSIGITASLCVNLSWLHGTCEDFSDRPASFARPDPVPKGAPSNQEQEEEYANDEPRDLYDPRTLFVINAMNKYMAKHNKRIEVEEAEKEAQRVPPVAEQPSRSDSSLESIHSTDLEPPITGPPRRSQRVKANTAVKPVVTSKKRSRASGSSSTSSVDESPTKRQRSTKKGAAKSKSPKGSSPAVDDSAAPPPPAVRRSARTRKAVSR